jgi:plasmid stabilization system protein ParE
VPALPVVLTRRAARQVEAAALWWKANRPAAPNALRDDLAGGQPACGAPTVSRRSSGVRRVHLARIGYHVYYRVAPRLRQVQILAFWHARREAHPQL